MPRGPDWDDQCFDVWSELESERKADEASIALDADHGLAPWFPRVVEQQGKTFGANGSGLGIGHALTEHEMRNVIGSLKWPFYVYVLCSDSGDVFYVGKGTADRVFCHRREAEAGVQSEKCRVIRCLGDRLRYGLFAVCKDEDWALMLESTLINLDYALLTNVKPGRVEHVVNAAFRDPALREGVRLITRINAIVRRMEDSQRRVEDAFMRRFPWASDAILGARNQVRAS